MPKILIKEILFFPLEIKLFDGVLFIVKVADECIISFITHFKANEKLLKNTAHHIALNLPSRRSETRGAAS